MIAGRRAQTTGIPPLTAAARLRPALLSGRTRNTATGVTSHAGQCLSSNSQWCPFDCLLSECLLTAIYRVPQFFAAAGEGFSHVVLDADDFRAGITTDPEEYLAQNDLAGQFANDPAWRAWVRACCNSDPGKSATKLHVVLQVRQELSAWPATDGQCWKADLGLGEHLLFVDGGEHPVPPFDDKPHWRNAVLAAVRVKLDATGSFEKVGDQVSYRTTDDRWLDLLRLSVSSPEGSTSTPLATEELREKARGVAAVVSQIRAQVDSVGADPAPLRQLLDALQLGPANRRCLP